MAAKDKSRKLWLKITKVDQNQPAGVEANVAGAGARSAAGQTLTAPQVDSVNTFDAPVNTPAHSSKCRKLAG